MGKNGKERKRRRLENQKMATPPSDAEDSEHDVDFLLGLVSRLQLQNATHTLNTLSKHAEELKNQKSAELKAFRAALYDYTRTSQAASGEGTSLVSRISIALADHRHTDALVLLAELRIRGGKPKLGALQRWVRDCDAASRADGSYGDEEVLRVLDSILRCTGGDEGIEHDWPDMKRGKGAVIRQDEWRYRSPSTRDIYAEIKAGTFPLLGSRDLYAKRFYLLESTPGPERLPPNHHPALLFASHPSAILLDPAAPLPVKRHEVPHVPGAFLLTDVLTQNECLDILASAESVGFKPDEPVADEGKSVLAHNLYWLADKPFLETFCKRFLHLVPQELNGGRVTGINARFRVYRYVPGAIYRPHIDGAWPASGIDATTGKYLYDSSSPSAPQWSRLTFLIYLNDKFDLGHTTFFLPNPAHVGQMHAFPVKPSVGCALVFPHGDTDGSLLHEGSPVGEGAKYVIRTEVLYEVKPRDGQKQGVKDEQVEAGAGDMKA